MKCNNITCLLAMLLVFTVSSCKISKRSKLNDEPLYVQAEEMHLNDYVIDKIEDKACVKLKGSTGTASFNFDYPSGYYDIDASYLAESVGQNTYTLYIAGNQIVAWLGKTRDDQWHYLSEQKWHAPRHIRINQGDEVRIDALSEKGSMVIFDYLKFSPSNRNTKPAGHGTLSPTPVHAAPEILASPNDYLTVFPEEYEHAIKNPLKGFRAYQLDHEYGTLIKTYFKWNELENSINDGLDKIMETCNVRWKDYEKTNMKAIPRVYLDWPGQKSGWPADMVDRDYTSDQFKERVVALIKKLGQAWDNDPRVAFVEMGLVGEWGEQEFPDTREDIKEAIAAQFHESFKNKLVMIRWPNTYNDHLYNFGYYWDSFAHLDQEYYTFHVHKTSPKWKTAVIGGEPAYNWGNANIQPGTNPDASLKNQVHRDYIIDRIRKLHANHLGWISEYNHQDEQVRKGAEIMQKAFGYRLILTEVTYPKTIQADAPFIFSFKVKNTGSTPFYYNWPVEVSLLDPISKAVVWKEQCTDLDIRSWLPGDDWDASFNAYATPAETYTVNQTITITGVPSGEYILALAILDPAGNLPCARFAIKNYYKGGRHPIGKLGVNQSIADFQLHDFDDVQSDNSLHYLYN